MSTTDKLYSCILILFMEECKMEGMTLKEILLYLIENYSGELEFGMDRSGKFHIRVATPFFTPDHEPSFNAYYDRRFMSERNFNQISSQMAAFTINIHCPNVDIIEPDENEEYFDDFDSKDELEVIGVAPTNPSLDKVIDTDFEDLHEPIQGQPIYKLVQVQENNRKDNYRHPIQRYPIHMQVPVQVLSDSDYPDYYDEDEDCNPLASHLTAISV